MTKEDTQKDKEIELSENEKAVLKILERDSDTWGENCLYLKWIEGETGLTRKEVQKACKVLRELEFVEYHRGLMDYDGKVAGSGYCITHEGATFINPCVICGERPADMRDGECDSCWHERKCINCGKEYRKHSYEEKEKEFKYEN